MMALAVTVSLFIGAMIGVLVVALCQIASNNRRGTLINPVPALNFDRTAEWLKVCAKEIGNAKHISLQAGCHLEEVAELLDAVVLESNTGLASSALAEVSDVLKGIANTLKAGNAKVVIYDHEAALDALCDSEVTGNGLAYLLGYDKPGADQVVLASNEAKLKPDGTPVILPGGKIGKVPGWTPPDLSPFVPRPPEEGRPDAAVA